MCEVEVSIQSFSDGFMLGKLFTIVRGQREDPPVG